MFGPIGLDRLSQWTCVFPPGVSAAVPKIFHLTLAATTNSPSAEMLAKIANRLHIANSDRERCATARMHISPDWGVFAFGSFRSASDENAGEGATTFVFSRQGASASTPREKKSAAGPCGKRPFGDQA
jgi:hypothetical protein